MVAKQVVFHGNQNEAADLVNAIARNCSCEYALMGVRVNTCPPHRMLVEDQRALDGLVFMRHQVKQLRGEEFSK